MNKLITITSKGQTTLPAKVRAKIGLSKAGGVLELNFNERTGEITITKPVSITELSQRISRHLKKVTKPLQNVDEYYQANRKTS